jgi:hypothetical protein
LGYDKHDVVGGDGDRERWRRLGERRKKFKGRGRADSPPPPPTLASNFLFFNAGNPSLFIKGGR